ncbi:MAG: OapB/ArvB family protein, partial [Candidatus Woesearchaeota archaeon]
VNLMIKMTKIRVISYSDIEDLSVNEKVEKILDLIKKEFVVVINGKLSIDEKNELYKKNLNQISKDLSFHGIEIAELFDKKESSWPKKVKKFLLKIFAGNKIGLTLVGPAEIIKEIKQDPDKIDILANV